MEDTIAVLTHQLFNQSTLLGSHLIFINIMPVSLIEIECLLTVDRIMGIQIPGDQPELWKILDDNDVGSCF